MLQLSHRSGPTGLILPYELLDAVQKFNIKGASVEEGPWQSRKREGGGTWSLVIHAINRRVFQQGILLWTLI
jgi:hypothetical protein